MICQPLAGLCPSKIMSIFKALFLLLFLPSTIRVTVTEPCPISMCGSKGIPIRFPFQRQDQNCGYPGFNLSCNGDQITVLKLPYAGEFFVRGIDYMMQQIQLYDPDNCLPRRLLRFNLSGSPFAAAYSQMYTFLSCPSQLAKPSGFRTVDCLGSSTISVIATSSTSLANSMPPSCKIIATLAVPVTWPDRYYEGFSTSLNGDLRLRWDVPDCGACEAQGSLCGFKSNASQEIGCFDFPKAPGKFNFFYLFLFIFFIFYFLFFVHLIWLNTNITIKRWMSRIKGLGQYNS
jgi:hypothetical protein